MVDREAEKRKNIPAYSLDTIIDLAKNQRVGYATRKVTKDIDNLGCSFDDVCECISMLKNGEFCESIKYPNKAKWLDRYTTCITTASCQLVRVYIKLRLDNGCLAVTLDSFHRENP